jgi:hypothetical protein
MLRVPRRWPSFTRLELATLRETLALEERAGKERAAAVTALEGKTEALQGKIDALRQTLEATRESGDGGSAD